MKNFVNILCLNLVIGLSIFTSCEKSPFSDENNCTLEHKTEGITVIGDTLTQFYTIRESNNDTIRFSKANNHYYHQQKWYPVLSDDFSGRLKDQSENFRFIGEVKGLVKVNERFVFTSDGCHIEKLSGKKEVKL